MFGNEFLVGPVVEKGSIIKEMHFPEGRWINYWTGEKYEGNQTLTIHAPLLRIPLFVREGSIIPMRDYARSVELGNNNLLTLDIYPGENSSFILFEDDGTSNAYLEGEFVTTAFHCFENQNETSISIEASKGWFPGMPSKREYVLNIHLDHTPGRILLNGEKIKYSSGEKTFRGENPCWYYDSTRRLLIIRIMTPVTESHTIKYTHS